MPVAKIKKTSANSMAVEPFEIRSNPMTRLVFKPLLVNNVTDQTKPVKGELLWQKRSRKGEAWLDEKDLKLSTMTAGSGVKLELTTSELFTLTQVVRGLYGLYWKHNNQWPEIDSVELADYAIAARFMDSGEVTANLLNVLGQGTLTKALKLLAKQENAAKVIEGLAALEHADLSEINVLAGIGLLRKSLDVWREHNDNHDEEFWQTTLSDYSFVLSQVFSVPVIVISEKAHVGGKNIANKGGKQSDFLLKNAATDHLLLVEIKTPVTELLEKTEYRQNVFAPSKELGGSLTQIATYKQKLSKEFNALAMETNDTMGEQIRLAEPRSLVIVGNTAQLDNASKKDSFELFRRGLKHAEVITFDELFSKIATLVKLLEGELSDVDG